MTTLLKHYQIILTELFGNFAPHPVVNHTDLYGFQKAKVFGPAQEKYLAAAVEFSGFTRSELLGFAERLDSLVNNAERTAFIQAIKDTIKRNILLREASSSRAELLSNLEAKKKKIENTISALKTETPEEAISRIRRERASEKYTALAVERVKLLDKRDLARRAVENCEARVKEIEKELGL